VLDVRRLWILREVARQGTFAAAAHALGYSPAAISSQVATLEQEVGATLIDRSPRGATLTEIGERLLWHAEVILDRMEQAEADVEATLARHGQMIRLAVFPAALVSLVPEVIERLRQRVPEAEVMLAEAPPDEALERVETRTADIAVVFWHGRQPQLPPGLDVVNLFEDPIHLAVRADHRLAEGPLTYRDVLGEPWIAPRTGPSHRRFHDGPLSGAHVVVETDDLQATVELVSAGVGLGLVSGLVPHVRDDVVLRYAGETRHVAGLLRSDRHRSAVVREALRALAELGASLTERGAHHRSPPAGRTPPA